MSTLVDSYSLMANFLVAEVTAHLAINLLYDNWSQLFVGELMWNTWAHHMLLLRFYLLWAFRGLLY